MIISSILFAVKRYDKSHGNLQKGPPPQKSTEVTQLTLTNLERLMTLVDDLLERARLQAGEIRARHEAYPPKAFGRGAYDLLSRAAEGKGIELALTPTSCQNIWSAIVAACAQCWA